MKLNSFCKDTITRKKQHLTEWEKIFTILTEG